MAKDNKYKKLLLGIILDGVGILTSSWVLPIIGDFGDIIWAPIAGYAMTRMYKGRAGKIAGIVTFVEEAVPGLDIIPSFSLMWIYTYLLSDLSQEEQ